MDKYQLFAVNHYFSSYPEHINFDEFIGELEKDHDIEDLWPAIEYEGIPNVDLAELVKSMINCLRMTFRNCE
jgi:hypothetical protein